MCRFRIKILSTLKNRRAFSLIEVSAALVILALVSSSVVVIVNRCIKSAIDSQMRIEAFELARENMEKLLAGDSVSETIESGFSEKNPDIRWQSVVETFYESNTSRMWIRAVCSSSFIDYEGQEQTVELTHWLTDVSKQQMLEIIEEKQRQKAQQQAQDQAQDQPQDQAQQDSPDSDKQQTPQDNKQAQSDAGGEELFFGYTREQLQAMSFSELWALLVEHGYFQ